MCLWKEYGRHLFRSDPLNLMEFAIFHKLYQTVISLLSDSVVFLCCFMVSQKRFSMDSGEKSRSSFGEDLERPEKKKYGLFSKMSRNPECPSERICHSTLAQCPRLAVSTHYHPPTLAVSPFTNTHLPSWSVLLSLTPTYLSS